MTINKVGSMLTAFNRVYAIGLILKYQHLLTVPNGLYEIGILLHSEEEVECHNSMVE